VNAIVRENRRRGTADWVLHRPALAREIEGYASAASVQRGTPLTLHVSTQASRFEVELFRFGWYGGLGARRLLGPVPCRGGRQAEAPMDGATGLVDCAWAPSIVIDTREPGGEPWPSGVYLARLTAAGSGAQSYAIFTVRDDTRRPDLLVQQSVTTWQAYNPWGGRSLYRWGSEGGVRACKVSFNRPYAANPQNVAAASGMGAGEFLTNLQPHPQRYGFWNAGWECNLVRWLEREGCDVGYATNLDTHAAPPHCKAWISSGHDEYWSAAMRDHVEAARDGGVNLAFLSANTAYWQIELEARGRVMVCHKKSRKGTGRWRDAGRPEEALLGVMYAGDPVDGDLVVADASHALFEGSGLADGDRLSGLLGYEVDAIQGCGPPGVKVLCASPWRAEGERPAAGTSHMTLHRAAGGALVFAAGTMQWAWGLDDFNAPALRPARSSAAAQCVTRNLLAQLLR
jgi:hypothetical protein